MMKNSPDKRKNSPEKKEENSPEQEHKRSAVRTYVRYSSLAFQMIFIILAGVFSGRWLDQELGLTFPVFLLTFTLLALALSFYLLFREVLKK